MYRVVMANPDAGFEEDVRRSDWIRAGEPHESLSEAYLEFEARSSLGKTRGEWWLLWDEAGDRAVCFDDGSPPIVSSKNVYEYLVQELEVDFETAYILAYD